MPRFAFLAGAVAAVGGTLFGYDTGVISGAALFIQPALALNIVQVELVVSAPLIGAAIGAIGSARVTDSLGRRIALLAAAAMFAIGALGSAFSVNALMLVSARIIVGLAIGAASYAVPLYISELAPANSRGWLVSMNQLAITVGILLSYAVDYAFSSHGDWRWMLGLAVVPAVFLFVGVASLPETPRWVGRAGKPDLARQVLVRLRGRADVQAELSEIETVCSEPDGWQALHAPRLRVALVVGIGLAIFQQATGVNTVIYYAPTIIRSAGIPSASGAILATAGIGTVNVVMTIVAMVLLDRLGRRPLLIGGLVVMAAALTLQGFAFASSRPGETLSVVSMMTLMVYIGAFALGLGPIFWLLISEIYPLHVRGTAMGVATTANWISNLLVSSTFLTLVSALGPAVVFWGYAFVTGGALVFAYVMVPETKGRTLEQIEGFWRSQKTNPTPTG
jgi:MFS transporter, SP family, galactose:H+ symporter